MPAFILEAKWEWKSKGILGRNRRVHAQETGTARNSGGVGR